jgi:AcrR family transcriptional regulator
MGRTPRFTDDQLIDAARDAIATYGRGATIAQVGAVSGAPTGSIYHRFRSREQLMILLWLRSIERFHVRLFAVADEHRDPEDALVAMAVETARYCRQHPSEALAMTLYRYDRLVVSAPESLLPRVIPINDRAFKLLATLGARCHPEMTHDQHFVEMIFTCVVGLCYGLIRPYIVSGTPIPDWLDPVIISSCRAALSSIADEPELAEN